MVLLPTRVPDQGDTHGSSSCYPRNTKVQVSITPVDNQARPRLVQNLPNTSSSNSFTMRAFNIHLVLACAISLVSSQSNTGSNMPVETVVSLFLGSRRESNYSFAGSVIAVDETATTYQVACSSGALNLPGFPTTTCDVHDPVSRSRNFTFSSHSSDPFGLS